MSERKSAKTEHAHHHKHSKSNKVLRTVSFVLTPFLLLLFVFGLFSLALLKPYNNIKPYLDTVFNPENTLPDEGQISIYHSDDLELNVREIEIQEDETKDPEKHTIIYPYYGDRYGTLNIESVGMKDIPVYCGTTLDILELGAGWDYSSVFIGKVGRVVLWGHNHTWFYMLPQVQNGDIVTLETDYVKMTYIVKDRAVFHETDRTYTHTTPGEDHLTLGTCWNNGMLGMSVYRLGILCDLVSREWKEVEVPQE